MRVRMTRLVLGVVVATVLSAGITPAAAPATVRGPADPVIAAAGDIACDPRNPAFRKGNGTGSLCRAADTTRRIERLDPDAVLTLGDNQYDHGRLKAFRRSYRRSWGTFLDRTSPVPGNHDYETKRAGGYFTYFGARAGERGKGYYSFDLGTWHVVALNSNCWIVECAADSPQARWLERDLRKRTAGCTLAYWHHPRWSSGLHGDNPSVAPLLRVLYREGADVVLAGHDHHYERLAPMTPEGKLDATGGVRQFIVGTAGAQLYPVPGKAPHSEVRRKAFGILEMTLHAGTYDWRFDPLGSGPDDEGTGICNP
ncbi:MAG: metallophosphoesterase [Actinomycetota bacterium]